MSDRDAAGAPRSPALDVALIPPPGRRRDMAPDLDPKIGGRSTSFCCNGRVRGLLCCRLDASVSHKNMNPIRTPLLLRTRRLPAHLAALVAALLLALCLMPAFAAPPPNPAETETLLAAARKQIDDIRKRVADETDDATLVKQRGDALDIQSKADAALSLIHI